MKNDFSYLLLIVLTTIQLLVLKIDFNFDVPIAYNYTYVKHKIITRTECYFIKCEILKFLRKFDLKCNFGGQI